MFKKKKTPAEKVAAVKELVGRYRTAKAQMSTWEISDHLKNAKHGEDGKLKVNERYTYPRQVEDIKYAIRVIEDALKLGQIRIPNGIPARLGLCALDLSSLSFTTPTGEKYSAAFNGPFGAVELLPLSAYPVVEYQVIEAEERKRKEDELLRVNTALGEILEKRDALQKELSK